MADITAIKELITSRVDVVQLGHDSPCWISDRAGNGRGYTKLAIQGRFWYTHRLAYTLWVGDIPDGLVIDHLCRNRACCNPEHLEPVTTRDNLLRGETSAAREAAQTHCKRGHLLAGANLYRRPDGSSKRECRNCRNSARRRSKAQAA